MQSYNRENCAFRSLNIGPLKSAGTEASGHLHHSLFACSLTCNNIPFTRREIKCWLPLFVCLFESRAARSNSCRTSHSPFWRRRKSPFNDVISCVSCGGSGGRSVAQRRALGSRAPAPSCPATAAYSSSFHRSQLPVWIRLDAAASGTVSATNVRCVHVVRCRESFVVFGRRELLGLFGERGEFRQCCDDGRSESDGH